MAAFMTFLMLTLGKNNFKRVSHLASPPFPSVWSSLCLERRQSRRWEQQLWWEWSESSRSQGSLSGLSFSVGETASPPPLLPLFFSICNNRELTRVKKGKYNRRKCMLCQGNRAFWPLRFDGHGGLLPELRFPYLRMTGWHRGYLPLPLARSLRLALRGPRWFGHVRKQLFNIMSIIFRFWSEMIPKGSAFFGESFSNCDNALLTLNYRVVAHRPESFNKTGNFCLMTWKFIAG